MTAFKTYLPHDQIAACCILVATLVFFGCRSGEKQPDEASDPEIPEHVLEVDSLTVYPADSEPVYSIDLVPVQSYGDSVGPNFRRIYSCAVDENDRVIVRGNTSSNTTYGLHVYNPDGTYHTQIGQRGRGPGEFENISSLQIKSGKIFVEDISNNRLSMFNTKDYSFERATVLQDWSVRNLEAVRNMRLLSFYARSDGNHLAVFDEYPPPKGRRDSLNFFLVDSEGNALNHEPLIVLSSGYSISSKNQNGFTLPLPFLGVSLIAFSNDDAIYTARTDDFLIKEYDAKGSYQSAFYYPVKGPPFDLDSMDGFFGHSLSDIRNALEENDVEFPDSRPVLRSLRVDDENRIWAALTVEYMKTYEWWVLGKSGELLAKFVRPFNQHQICDIRDGYVYLQYFDMEGEEDRIVKHRIEFRER